jgi:hypothetical protein
MVSPVTGKTVGMEKMTQMKIVQAMQTMLANQPTNPLPMKNGPGLNMTSGWLAKYLRQKIGTT